MYKNLPPSGTAYTALYREQTGIAMWLVHRTAAGSPPSPCIVVGRYEAAGVSRRLSRYMISVYLPSETGWWRKTMSPLLTLRRCDASAAPSLLCRSCVAPAVIGRRRRPLTSVLCDEVSCGAARAELCSSAGHFRPRTQRVGPRSGLRGWGGGGGQRTPRGRRG